MVVGFQEKPEQAYENRAQVLFKCLCIIFAPALLVKAQNQSMDQKANDPWEELSYENVDTGRRRIYDHFPNLLPSQHRRQAVSGFTGGGGINYLLSPTSEFTTNREKYMGLKWGRSNISLYYWWNCNEGMASFCNLNRLCINPSPLKFNYPSGIEMSPCKLKKTKTHTHNFCQGAWPERKKQKELTGWRHFILCSAEKSGPMDARHFLSHQRGKSDYFHEPRWECCEREKNGSP